MNPVQIAKALGCALVLSLVFYGGCSIQKSRDVEEISSLKIEVAESKAKLEKEKRLAAEQIAKNYKSLNEKVAAQSAKHLKIQEDAKKDFDNTIAKLRSNELRVRDRLTCPANPASPPTGEVATGLQREDAEFLLREGERANDVVRKYNEAMDLLDLIYSQQK